MRLVVTGGGTGGHVYPALEIGLAAIAEGWDVRYLGSLRGQEGSACAKVGISFTGFQSEPVYRLHTIQGIKRLTKLMKASKLARESLESIRPDAVFATGGYSAAPVLNAARRLGIPLVLHEQNTVPGRTNKLMCRSASAVCTVFHAAAKHFPASLVHRTGMPIRHALRNSSQGTLLMDAETGRAAPRVLVMGGSQGSAALNDLALSTAFRMTNADVQWLHLTGLGHFESTMETLRKMGMRPGYTIKAYLEADEMASAIFNSSVALCRSGAGSMAELAAYRKPSILVPYPFAFERHQHKNAMEFAEMGSADMIDESELDSAKLEARLLSWIFDKDRVAAAQTALAEWDVPDSVPRILDIVRKAARK